MYDFTYKKVGSIDDAVTAHSSADEARYMSGGMTLLPTLKLRLDKPSDVIDLAAIDGLARSIDRAAEKLVPYTDHAGSAFGADHCAGTQQHGVAQHHHDRVAVAKADRLGKMALPAAVDDRADGADWHAEAADFDQPAIAGDHAAEAARRKIDRSAGDPRKRFVDQVQH